MPAIKFGSLFSGIGGFDLGFERAGMRCAWQVEIDEQCRNVLMRHWPDVKRYEDVRDVGKRNLEAVDLICGGFPCQDLSVAGRREGLAGERSGLWFEFLRIVGELKPEWIIVENVPGLLSSDEGRDMGILLGGLAKCGYWWAYRVLDAQFFRVPQRRRRVFIVASPRAGCPPKVLFEPEGSPWDTPPRRAAGARVAAPIKASAPSRRNGGSDPIADEFIPDVAYALPAEVRGTGDGHGQGWNSNYLAYGLSSRQQRNCHEDNYVVARPLAHGSTQDHYDESQQTYVVGPLQSHSARHGHAMTTQQAVDARQLVCFDTTQITSPGNYSNPRSSDVCHPLTSEAHPPAIAFAWQQGVSENDRSYPVRQGDYAGSISETRVDAVAGNFGVRRLTPMECERLQGFPDGYTDGQADSVRYRQLGNAVCIPVAEWLGRRLLEALRSE